MYIRVVAMMWLLALALPAQAAEPLYLRLDTNQSVRLGQGWSSILQKPMSADCVSGQSEVVTVNKWEEDFSFYVENQKSSKTRGSAGNAEIGFTYKLVSVDLNGSRSNSSFTRSSALQESAVATIRFLRHIERLNPKTPDSPVVITDSNGAHVGIQTPIIAIKPGVASISDWKKFHRVCGDYFVASVLSGGELNANLIRTFSDYLSRKCFKRSSGGSFGIGKIFSLGGSSSSNGCDTQGWDKERVSVTLDEHGDPTTRTLVTDLETLKTHLQGYGTRVKDNSTPLYALLVPYKSLLQYKPDDSDNAVTSRLSQLIQSHARFSFIETTAQKASDERRELLPDQFEFIHRSELKLTAEPLDAIEAAARSQRVALEAEISEIRECINKALSSADCKPFSRRELPSDYPLRVMLPLPKSKLTAPMISYLRKQATPREKGLLGKQRSAYAAAVMRTYVDNTARERCRELDECDDQQDPDSLHADLASLAKAGVQAGISDDDNPPRPVIVDARTCAAPIAPWDAVTYVASVVSSYMASQVPPKSIARQGDALYSCTVAAGRIRIEANQEVAAPEDRIAHPDFNALIEEMTL